MQILRFSFVMVLATAFAVTATRESEAQEKLTGWSEQAAAAWWQQHPAPDSWEAGATRLHAALLAAQEEHGIQKVFANRHFTAWLKHLRWLSLHREARGFLATAEGAAIFARIGREAPLLLELFTGSLSTYDNAPRAAEILCEIYAANPKDAIEYRKLAVAFALVFDQPFPGGWPHPNTRKSQLAIGNEDPVERFQFCLRCVDAKAFLLDPKRLTVRELMCVVDTPLEFRELQYVQQVKLKSAARLQDVYQAIPYEKARLDDGQLMWSGSTYRLIDIGRAGGICADQAFYMTQCGKAKGIPTVIFVGQGQNGGHAWTGFMPEPGKWNMSVAKYRQEKYPVGKAFDPQSWRRVTGDQLNLLVKAQAGGSTADKAARLVLQWAAMNPVHPGYADLLAHARKLAPQMLEAWEMEESRLFTGTSSPSKWRAFWQQWVTAFRDQPDLEFRGQMRLMRAMRAQGDTSAEERLRRGIENDNASGRFDLAIAIAADGVLELLETGKLEDANRAFGGVIDDFKAKAGGHLFYNLVVPYIDLTLEKGHGEQAAQALWTVDSELKFAGTGTVNSDLKKLKDRVRNAAD